MEITLFKEIVKKVIYLFKEALRGFIDDKAVKLSAALSYYTIFSLPPLLIIIISICGYFFGDDAVRGQIFWQIKGLVGSPAALHIQEAIKNVKLSSGNTFAVIAGVVILIFGASGVFSEIQDSLNLIWGIEARPKRGFIKFILNRVVSFSMIGSVGFLLMVGLLVNTLTDILNKSMTVHFPKDAVFVFYLVNVFIVFVIITLLFTLIYKALPDGKVALRDCLIGASLAALLFMIGKFGMGAYLASSAFTSVYGTAGSVILILIWVYYSAIILYFGAEFTKVYAHTHGKKIVPNAFSILVLIQKIEVVKV